MQAWDCETTGVDGHHGAKPYFVTVYDGKETTFYEWDVDPLTRDVTVPKSDKRAIQDELKKVHNWSTFDEEVRERHVVIGQNLKFDIKALATLGITDWPWQQTRDTLLAAHLLHSNSKHDLTALSLKYLRVRINEYEDTLERIVKKCRAFCRKHHKDWLIAKHGLPCMPSAKKSGKEKAEKLWKFDCWLPRTLAQAHDLPLPDGECEHEWGEDNVCTRCQGHHWWTALSEYANVDGMVTYGIWQVQKRRIEKKGLWSIYKEQLKLLPILYEMEQHGVTESGVNHEKLTTEYTEKSLELGEDCVDLADSIGYELKLPKNGVNDSLRKVLLEGFKVEPIKGAKSKTDKPSFDKYIMEHYTLTLPRKSKAGVFVRKLLAKRSLDTALTFMTSYKKFRVPLVLSEERVSKGGDREVVKRVLEDWYVLYPSLNPTGTATLRMSSTSPNEQQVCCDGETEILTTLGWVRMDQLKDKHKVAQYWKEDGSIDFVKPEIHRPHFKGEMVHLKTEQSIDLLVTPKHRCLLRNRKSKNLFDVEAHDFRTDSQHIQGGIYQGGGLHLSKWQIVWLCAVQADGSYQKSGTYDAGIRFILRKKRKIARLRRCLAKLGVKHTQTHMQKGGVGFYIHKHDPSCQLARRIMPDKQFGKWLLKLSRKNLDRFVGEVFFWDGDWTRKASWTSSIKNNADWVQIAFCLSGKRAALASRVPNSKWSKGNDHHFVNITNTDCSMTTNFTSEKVPWDDKVYCVTVPSSYIVVRRNGKVSVTGNSAKKGFNLRYCFGPPPGWEWWCLDYENIELRIPAYESGEQSMIELFEKPDVPPYFGSNHLLACHILHPKMFEECVNDKGEIDGRIFKDRYQYTWYGWTKNGNFAVQYGAQLTSGTADRAYHLNGAQAIIQKRLGKINDLNRQMIDMANRLGYVETIPDRAVNPHRGYPIYCTRTGYGKVLETVPLSYHIQSTAMQATRKAMVRCSDQLIEWRKREAFCGKMIMQCHDELDFAFPKGRDSKSNVDRIMKLKRLMEKSGEDIGIPLKVGVSYHPNNWSEKEKYEIFT